MARRPVVIEALFAAAGVWVAGCRAQATNAGLAASKDSPRSGAPSSLNRLRVVPSTASRRAVPGGEFPIVETNEAGRQSLVRPEVRRSLEREVSARFHSPDPPDEVFALERYPAGGGEVVRLEVTVRGPRSQLRWVENDRVDRWFERSLTAEEFARLRSTVVASQADRLHSLVYQAWDGVEYCYLHALPFGAFRYLINNPGEEDKPYKALIDCFKTLGEPSRLRLRYATRRLPERAEVVYASPTHQMRAVGGVGKRIRVFANEYYMTDAQWYTVTAGGPVPEIEPNAPPGPSDPTEYGEKSPARKAAERARVFEDVAAGQTYVVADGNLFRLPSAHYVPADWNW